VTDGSTGMKHRKAYLLRHYLYLIRMQRRNLFEKQNQTIFVLCFPFSLPLILDYLLRVNFSAFQGTKADELRLIVV
jgi:hypothetical protein